MKINTLFCIRPATRNIGNDIINKATADLIYEAFGDDAGIVNIPALKGSQFGGITAKQVYDANRFANGVIVGGGNLFENGQLTIETQALDSLDKPMMIIGLSHGRIVGTGGQYIHRSDAMPPSHIKQLTLKSQYVLVRDYASQELLNSIGCSGVEVGGCPTMFLPANPTGYKNDGRILISLRHPSRMSVPPVLSWRVAEDVRTIIKLLQKEYGDIVSLVCHDYADLEFASGFTDVPHLYFDDVNYYIETLRNARLNITYRLHAFLPCLAFGTPTVHLTYDERGKSMINTAAMMDWEIDINNNSSFYDALMDRIKNIDLYFDDRDKALQHVNRFREVTIKTMNAFADKVNSSF